ncbi:hypothetical protein H1R20_g725, partial [Candolleomyces eurysporus]
MDVIGGSLGVTNPYALRDTAEHWWSREGRAGVQECIILWTPWYWEDALGPGATCHSIKAHKLLAQLQTPKRCKCCRKYFSPNVGPKLFRLAGIFHLLPPADILHENLDDFPNEALVMQAVAAKFLQVIVSGSDPWYIVNIPVLQKLDIQGILCKDRVVRHEDQAEDNVDMKIGIPSIRGDFKLALIYSVLLAIQTVTSLGTPPPPPPAGTPSHPTTVKHSPISFALELDIGTLQVFRTLPKRDIVTRIDRFNSVVTSKVFIGVKGESGRLKIPSGFVVSDLVFDTTIVIKALQHIAHITEAGRSGTLLLR